MPHEQDRLGMPRRKLKVVVGMTSRAWGGNEKWAATTASGLAGRGHDVTVFYSHAQIGRELDARGLNRALVPLLSGFDPLAILSLMVLLKRLRPDVLILTKQREYWMGGLAARFSGRPLVVLRMGLKRRLRDDLRHRASFGHLSDLVIVNSHDVEAAIKGPDWFDAQKVRLLMNGVETDPPDAEAGRLFLEELGAGGETRVVVAAGRLTRQKGFDVLIDAFVHVTHEVPSAKLIILGEGRRLSSLAGRAEAAGLGASVVFPGHRSGVRNILAAADVYALSSRNEGMANTLLEAMSVGAPIAATDVSGTREAVRPGADALVVPPNDPEALGEAIVRLLGDAELSRRLGESALARARGLFGVERMISEFEAMLLSELDVEGARGGGAESRDGLEREGGSA